MEPCPANAHDIADRLAALAKLWPNRTHESNWMKDVLCRLTLHRWHRVDVPGLQSTRVTAVFCRWCTAIRLIS